MRSCSACRAVSTVIYISAERPCRYIGARRYAICRRNVHSTQPLLRLDGSPKIPEAVYSQQVDRISEPSEIRSTASPANGSSGGAGDPPDGSGKPVARSNYGSALRRAARNLKKFPEIPRFELPQSFLQHNVVLWEDAPSETHSVTGTVVPVDTAFDPKVVASNENLENSPSAAQIAERKDSSNNHSGRADRPVWRVDGRVIEEIESVMRANLQVPARQGIKPTIAARPHLVLHCPRKGGIASMDAVIRHLATSNKADLIKLDAQDLAGLGGNYLDGPGDPKPESLSTLGYDVHAPVEAHDHTVTMESFSTPERISIAAGDVAVIPLSTEIVQTIANMLKGRHSPPKSQQPLASAASKDMGLTTAESTRELKLAFFLDALLGACDTKRAVKGAEAETPDTESPTNGSDDVKDLDQVTTAKSSSDAPSKASRPVILQIDDYPEISHTDNGNWLLSAIHDALYQRRIEGQRIILIGTCSAENPELAPARLNHQILPHDFASAPTRTIVTPAVVEREPKATFLRYHRLRNMVINAKNLRDMTRRLAGTPDLIDNLPSDTIRGTYMPEEVILKMQRHVWSSGYAHRVSMVALGINQRNNEALTTKHIEEAISMVEGTDKAKHSWTNGDKGRNRVSDGNGPGSKANKWRSGSKKERAQLEKECNEHEKKLLNGMINPADIRTTFDNVHVSKETVQTLKDLTLLPLACPQEFEYGVLAEQNISGLLLYGPPGTGKTLLAKAVAKDGGATILEVSGAGTLFPISRPNHPMCDHGLERLMFFHC